MKNVYHSNLNNINPYYGDPEIQAYLHFGCLYSAHEQARKYEAESAQERVKSELLLLMPECSLARTYLLYARA